MTTVVAAVNEDISNERDLDSVVQGDDHRWHMFYTGATVTDEGQLLQQIGPAVSDDLYSWHKDDRNPLVRADSRW